MKATYRITILLFLVFAWLTPAVILADGLDPHAIQVIGKIVSDPRYDQKKFMKALVPTGELKKQVIARNLLDDLNDFFGWNLPAVGGWPPEETNDLIYEVVLSPRYDAEKFLLGLEKGGPLLRELRRRQCVDRFNIKLGTALPATGAVPFQQANKLFYDVVAKPGFNGEKLVKDLCPASTVAAAARIPPAAAEPSPTTTVPAMAGAPSSNAAQGYGTLLAVLLGGILAGALLVLLAKSFARDLHRPVQPGIRRGK
ncbi:MAG TPA: hypothetical protein VIA62_18160 [Thermoanaerobaculia bacterium]|jgi:hypothetical protein|nr:hypothetical protein [Thermoanaerobaculia bacterium]